MKSIVERMEEVVADLKRLVDAEEIRKAYHAMCDVAAKTKDERDAARHNYTGAQAALDAEIRARQSLGEQMDVMREEVIALRAKVAVRDEEINNYRATVEGLQAKLTETKKVLAAARDRIHSDICGSKCVTVCAAAEIASK